MHMNDLSVCELKTQLLACDVLGDYGIDLRGGAAVVTYTSLMF